MKKTFFILLFLSSMIFLTQNGLATTYTFGDSYYWVVTTNMTWDEAKADANSTGGHLATITSQEEQDFIVNNIIADIGGTEWWLGGYKITASPGWAWVTGETWSYTNWNSYDDSWDEPVLGIWGPDAGGGVTTGGWNDEHSTYHYGYIAEVPIPEPNTIILLACGLLGLSLTQIVRRRNS